MMELVVTTGAMRRAKLQSNRRHKQTNTQFFTGRTPFLSPNSVRAWATKTITVTHVNDVRRQCVPLRAEIQERQNTSQLGSK